MASSLDRVSIRFGVSDVQTFSQSGVNEDWRTFHSPALAGNIRVFATASAINRGLEAHRGAPAAPVVGEISPRGFTIWARNSDIIRGTAAFNWIAVAEGPDRPAKSTGAVFGLLSPQYFASAAKPGDWSSYSAPRRWRSAQSAAASLAPAIDAASRKRVDGQD